LSRLVGYTILHTYVHTRTYFSFNEKNK